MSEICMIFCFGAKEGGFVAVYLTTLLIFQEGTTFALIIRKNVIYTYQILNWNKEKT